MSRVRVAAVAGAIVLGPLAARADRPLRGSVSAGGTLLVTGADGDRQRAELEVDVEPYSRYGAAVAWRGFDRGHRGLVTAALIYEAGAARPRLVVDLHGDVGVDLDRRAPVVGGGARTIVGVVGPLAVAVDTGVYLVIDGVDHSRLAIATGLGVGAAW